MANPYFINDLVGYDNIKVSLNYDVKCIYKIFKHGND